MLMLVKYGCGNPADCHKFSVAQSGDVIVLIQDGVFWAINDEVQAYKEKGIKIYAIESDLFARGYSKETSKVQLVSYDEFIELIENNEKILG